MFLCAQAFLLELEANQGSVVNIASIFAPLIKPGFVVYSKNKAALTGPTPSASSTNSAHQFHPPGKIGPPAEDA